MRSYTEYQLYEIVFTCKTFQMICTIYLYENTLIQRKILAKDNSSRIWNQDFISYSVSIIYYFLIDVYFQEKRWSEKDLIIIDQYSQKVHPYFTKFWISIQFWRTRKKTITSFSKFFKNNNEKLIFSRFQKKNQFFESLRFFFNFCIEMIWITKE